MDTTEIPTPQPGCDGDPLASITEHWADLLGCTKSMCAVMRSFNSSIDIGYAPMGLGEQVWAELTTLSNLVDAARISITPSIIASGRWKAEGSKSPEDWLAGKTGSSTGKARSQLETGKNLRKAPGTQESFLNGEISAEQADTIADAVEANPAAEDDLLDQAKRDSLKNLKDEAARRKAEVEDIEERERRLHRKRYVRQWTDKEGAWNLRARGPLPSGSEFMAVLEGLIDQQFKKARKAGIRGTRDNYAYDALMDLANQHGWGHGNGGSGGESGGTGPNAPTTPPADAPTTGDPAPESDASTVPGSGKPTPGRSASEHTRPANPGPGSRRRATTSRHSGSAGGRNKDPFEPVENHDGGKASAQDQHTGTNTASSESDREQTAGDKAVRRRGTTAAASGAPTSDQDPTNETSPPSEPGPETSENFAGRLFDLEPASRDFENAPEPETRRQTKPPGRTQAKPAKQRIFCIDWTALARGRIHPGERCELRGIGMVSVRTIRQALRSGTARMVITDADDRVVTVALIGTGAINARLFPMGPSNRLPLEAPDPADLTVAEASAFNGPCTVIVRVRLTDLAGTAHRSCRAATETGASRRTIELAGVGTVEQTRLTDLLGDGLAGRLADRGTAIRAIAHTGRAPSAAQRVALAWADTTCKVLGCHNQRVEIDHRNPWAMDRVTELDNLDPLCGHHHSLKTHDGWAFTNSGTNADHPQFVPPTDRRHPRFADDSGRSRSRSA